MQVFLPGDISPDVLQDLQAADIWFVLPQVRCVLYAPEAGRLAVSGRAHTPCC